MLGAATVLALKKSSMCRALPSQLLADVAAGAVGVTVVVGAAVVDGPCTSLGAATVVVVVICALMRASSIKAAMRAVCGAALDVDVESCARERAVGQPRAGQS